MKAIRLQRPRAPLELQNLPSPPLGPGDVRVRVRAAGICHSDAHYRAGISPVSPLPLTLGHEVAGIIDDLGPEVEGWRCGDRVCVHYLVTCGRCAACLGGREQFCFTAGMIGKHRDGGYAEFLVVPARNLVALPASIPFEQGAIMMCSSATSFHALKKARLAPGESAAVFGLGGLGFSAAQLAKALGAGVVYGVDVKATKLALVERYGVIAVDATAVDPVEEIRKLTGGRGVDVALELIGLPVTMRQSLRVLANGGRAALAGITNQSFEVYPYQELLNKEAELIGVSDHLGRELPDLIEYARLGRLNLTSAVTRSVPLEAAVVNQVLDSLESFGDEVRVVITPG
jgi:2-desacetyl-2-hydroxyethyl bacteriochlorophyllide A dehydrogenase